MTTYHFPLKGKEAKSLYLEMHKTHGDFSRQTGEAMVSFLQRWERAYALLKELDDSYVLSKELMGDK
eukprot:10903246-Karenia_brevis.AAC.1